MGGNFGQFGSCFVSTPQHRNWRPLHPLPPHQKKFLSLLLRSLPRLFPPPAATPPPKTIDAADCASACGAGTGRRAPAAGTVHQRARVRVTNIACIASVLFFHVLIGQAGGVGWLAG